jgi:hypothetical protein
MLLEAEGVKMIEFLLLLFKTENIFQRFRGYLKEKEFEIWAENVSQKIFASKSHLSFNPDPLIRAILSAKIT